MRLGTAGAAHLADLLFAAAGADPVVSVVLGSGARAEDDDPALETPFAAGGLAPKAGTIAPVDATTYSVSATFTPTANAEIAEFGLVAADGTPIARRRLPGLVPVWSGVPFTVAPRVAVPPCAGGAGLGGLVTDGLLALWRFDEMLGTTLHDYSGHGRHGQLVAGHLPTWTSTGLAFTTDQYVDLASAFGDDFADGFTVIAVAKPSTTHDTYSYPLLNLDYNTCLSTGIWRSRGVVYPPGSTAAFATTANTAPVGAWTDLAFVGTWGGKGVAYVDGRYANLKRAIGAYTAPGPYQYIGRREGTVGYFEGEIALAAVYDRPLTAAEVGSCHTAIAAYLAGRGIA